LLFSLRAEFPVEYDRVILPSTVTSNERRLDRQIAFVFLEVFVKCEQGFDLVTSSDVMLLGR